MKNHPAVVEASARQLSLDLESINRGARSEATKRKSAPFEHSFVRSEPGEPPSPLQRLMTGDERVAGRRGNRSGRGPDVRFRIYMCITLMAVREPYDVDRELRPPYLWNPRWYQRIGLPAGGTSSRILRYNLGWLAEHKFIEVQKRVGYGPTIKLLHIDGSGRPYEGRGQRYCQLPAAAFTSGWLVHLSATAMAVALMIDNQRRAHKNDVDDQQRIGIPGYDMERYALSADAWRLGAQELKSAGLLTYELKQTAHDSQTRNRYRLIDLRWDQRPQSPTTT